MLFVTLTGYVSCGNILVVLDNPSPSHTIWTTELAMGLVKKGHNVTWVGPGNFKTHKPTNNFHPIYLDGVGGEECDEVVDNFVGAPVYKALLLFYEYDLVACQDAYKTKGLQALLEYPDSFKFDALVMEITLSGCLLPLIKRFNFPPSIGYTPFLFPYYLALDFGSSIDHSYLPGFLVSFSDNMSFLERLVNYFWINADVFLRLMYVRPQIQKLAASKFGEDMDIEVMRRHVSLLLVNVDMTFHYPQQLAPNIIPVGGLHVQRARELPQDLKSIMDNSKKGVILFSLGTNVRADKLKPEIKTAMLEALGKFDYTVIWKFEKNLTDAPPNVILRKWIPQTEILVMGYVSCANILVVQDIPSPSHLMWTTKLAMGLVKKGHNVTWLGPGTFKKHKLTDNFHPIYLDDVGGEAYQELVDDSIGASTYRKLRLFHEYDLLSCQDTYKSMGLQTLLHYPGSFKFDALVIELTLSGCLLPLIKRFNFPPSIGVTPFLFPYYLALDFGNSIDHSYIPGFHVTFSGNMNFLERLINYFWINVDLFLRLMYLRPQIQKLAVTKFGEDMDIEVMRRHVSLLLVNLDVTFHYPQQLAPNVIPVGAHPKTVLFISHGGGLSIMEAAYFGVPVLGMPFIAEQFANMAMMESKAIARQTNPLSITTNGLYNSINEMLYNKKYAKNMKETSSRMRDQVQSPLERAVYWIEYSIRHNGTHILNLKSRDLPLFITNGLDIYLFLLLTGCAFVLAIISLCKYCFVCPTRIGGEASEDVVDDIIGAPTYKTLFLFYDYDILACQETYKTEGLQTLLDYPDSFKFDAVIIDLTLSGCLLPLIKRFSFPPSIGVTPFLFPYYLALDFGNSIDNSYIPGFLVSFSDNMSFLERLTNYFWTNTDLFLRHMYVKPQTQKLAATKFGEGMDLEEMRRHVSLLLVNVDTTFHYPQQLAPNIIPVGGLHVQRAGELPQDLKSIMDSSRKGVILFSLGTNVRSDKLKPEIKTAILEALGKFDQTVIWKFETNLTDVPPNVIIRNWVPQTEILAHPKTVLFISHGGGLSTIEAAYYGVPVLGMPFFVDQFTNLVMMENKGIARQINPHTITTNALYNRIKEMLDNKQYAKNMKKTSSRMRDQIQTPLERAVYWIEYSIRHNGTHILNLRSRDLPLFITNGLDIYVFLLLTGCAIALVIISLCKYCFACATRTGGDTSDEVVEDVVGASTYKTLLLFYEYDILACQDTHKAKGLQTLLDYPDNFKFDAIVIDLTLSGCLLPLIKRFNFPPSIGVTPFLFPYYLALEFGNSIDNSYIPGFLVSFSDNMSFLERLTNYFWTNLDLFLRHVYLKPQAQILAVTKFGEDMDLGEMLRHVSLLLVNVDTTFHYPQQLAPNIIPVGGLHVQRAGELPQDLKSIMDSSKKGVILFSLGTNVRSDKLKPEIKTAILEALGKFEQTVIWKFETNLTDVPPNVIIRKWVPQAEILAHPKTILFISHGGGLSTIEAAYYGVPVLGMPFFVDQFTNLVMMENKGIARQINPHTITTNGLYNSIKEMLDNKQILTQGSFAVDSG
nr:unnamed protein product [Callosobruchus analis]